MEKKTEVLVFRKLKLRGEGYDFTFSLSFSSEEELNRVKEALKPLGYTFRFPRR